MGNLQRIKSLHENRQEILAGVEKHTARLSSAKMAISEQEKHVSEAEARVTEAVSHYRTLERDYNNYGQTKVTLKDLTAARKQHGTAVKAVQEAKKQVEVLQAEHRSVEFARTPADTLPSVTRDLFKAVLDAEMEQFGPTARDIIGRLYALQQGVRGPGCPEIGLSEFLAEIFKDGVPVWEPDDILADYLAEATREVVCHE